MDEYQTRQFFSEVKERNKKLIGFRKDKMLFVWCTECPTKSEKFVSTTKNSEGLLVTFNGIAWALSNGYNPIYEMEIPTELELLKALPSLQKAPNKTFIHHFKGYGIHDSAVKVEVWSIQDKAIVLLSDIGKGTSVTNAAETIIEELCLRPLKNFRRGDCLFIETYPKWDSHLDIIVPTWSGDRVISVTWKHLGKLIKNEIN